MIVWVMVADQGHRSMVKVTRSNIALDILIDFIDIDVYLRSTLGTFNRPI